MQSVVICADDVRDENFNLMNLPTDKQSLLILKHSELLVLHTNHPKPGKCLAYGGGAASLGLHGFQVRPVYTHWTSPGVPAGEGWDFDQQTQLYRRELDRGWFREYENTDAVEPDAVLNPLLLDGIEVKPQAWSIPFAERKLNVLVTASSMPSARSRQLNNEAIAKWQEFLSKTHWIGWDTGDVRDYSARGNVPLSELRWGMDADPIPGVTA